MKIGFYMTVYRDELWAHRMVRQIKTFYPDSPVLITTDGLAHVPSLDTMEGATVLQFNRRLKVHGTGGLYSQRNLLAALIVAEQDDVDVMFKVDADSYMWRPFSHLPNAEWFGGIFSADTSLGTSVCCAGGCWGMRTSLIKRIAESKLLLDDRLLSKDLTYPRYSARAFKKEGDKGRDRELIIREDILMGFAANQLGVVPTMWDEVYLRQKGEAIQTPPYQYAVTHPVRSIP
jgi:hypothetical protein